MTDAPQIYLVLPPGPDPEALGRVLEGAAIACLRLTPQGPDEAIAHAADAVRAVAHAHDVAVVIADRVDLAGRLGLDGVHLTGGAAGVRKAREALGEDAVVGAHCGASRHDGMTAGEHGADYVAFDAAAERELFAWWSEMIEVPVVAEGDLAAVDVERLAPVADWLAFGPGLWAGEPLEALRGLTEPLRRAPA